MRKHLMTVLTEIRREGSDRRLALFIVDAEAVSLYQDLLFPGLRDVGLTPVTPDDVIPSPSLRLATWTLTLSRGAVVVMDVGTHQRHTEDRLLARALVPPERVLMVESEQEPTIRDEQVIGRPQLDEDAVLTQRFLDELQRRIVGVAQAAAPPSSPCNRGPARLWRLGLRLAGRVGLHSKCDFVRKTVMG